MADRDESEELEWRTRKLRIDPKLDAAGWRRPPRRTSLLRGPYRSEEEETRNGPADYALWLDNHIVAVVEAKKLTVGPQNVLTQADRYARGIERSPFNFNGLRCPFLYATNGEVFCVDHSPVIRQSRPDLMGARATPRTPATAHRRPRPVRFATTGSAPQPRMRASVVAGEEEAVPGEDTTHAEGPSNGR